jgi:hypothetical protein
MIINCRSLWDLLSHLPQEHTMSRRAGAHALPELAKCWVRLHLCAPCVVSVLAVCDHMHKGAAYIVGVAPATYCTPVYMSMPCRYWVP